MTRIFKNFVAVPKRIWVGFHRPPGEFEGRQILLRLRVGVEDQGIPPYSFLADGVRKIHFRGFFLGRFLQFDRRPGLTRISQLFFFGRI